MRRTFLLQVTIFLLGLASSVCMAENIVLVRDARPKACIVVPRERNWAVSEAVKELNYHIRKASGTELAIYSEDAEIPEGPRIYIGATREVEHDISSLPPNAFILKTSEGNLFLAGKDSPPEEKIYELGRLRGTLWAVYEFLERCMGVKWLWPGKSGEVIPKMENICVSEDIDVRRNPPFLSARWGNNPMRRVKNPTAEQLQFVADENLWLQRHRFAEITSPLVMHGFEEYYKRFFKKHPAYFQLLTNGRRGLLPGGENRPYQAGLCVSNPELHEQIFQDWKNRMCAQIRKTWLRDDSKWVFVGENDTLGFCCCEACRSWDAEDSGFATDPYWNGSRIPQHSERFNATVHLEDGGERPSLSDRYARFYLAVQKLFRDKGYGDIMVAGFAYANYTKAPKKTVLNENISITYVPPVDFPIDKAHIEEIKNDWDGWCDAGASLMTFRPNYTLSGYNLPISYAKEHCEMINHIADKKLAALFFDSMVGQYGAQAFTLYTIARLCEEPRLKYETVLKEFTSGFGPAESEIREYLEYWQQFSEKIAENREEFLVRRRRNNAERYWFRLMVQEEYFSPQVIQAGQALLDRASEKAKGTEAAGKVEFLKQGLKHAGLTMNAVSEWKRYQKSSAETDLQQFRKAFRMLYEYRDSIKDTNVSNLAILYRWENWLWGKYQKELKKEL